MLKKKKKGHKHIFKNTKQQRKNTLIINNIITILIKQKQAGQGHHHNDNNFNRRGKNGILRERILTIQIMTSHHKTTDKGRREGDARDSLNFFVLIAIKHTNVVCELQPTVVKLNKK